MTKNIHLLPTQNNKSKLAIYHYNDSKNIKIGELGLNLNNTVGWTNCWSEIELYITSDEEIKEPCWCWDILQNKIYWVHDTLPEYPTIGNYFKKIILTTDADLIKDGVQPINDEFLKWFVKNPSCESIEVEDVYKNFLNRDKKSVFNFRNKYKIIIPKKEPKQEHCDNCNNKICCCIIRKQETLEEVAEKYYNNYDKRKVEFAFIDGAKWQQKRSYSEEEVLNLLKKFYQDNNFNGTIMEWFEQFKKK